MRKERRLTRGRGAHLAWPGTSKGHATRAMGPRTNTEGSRDPMTSAVLTCVHAGRRVKKMDQQKRQGQEPQGRMHSRKWGGGQTKKKKVKPRCTAGGRKAQSDPAAGERVGGNGAEEGPRTAREKKTHVIRWRIGAATGGRGGEARKKLGPPTGPEGNKQPKQKGAGRERPVQGAQNGPQMDEDLVGPRHRVAGGPVGYKHGMRDGKRGRDREGSAGRAAQRPQKIGETRDAGNRP